MTRVQLTGPYYFQCDGNSFEEIPPGTPGVYLWCVQYAEKAYRLHYVGEATDIRSRLRQHEAKQLREYYTAFDPEKLVKNIKVLMHRPEYGMVGAFAGGDAKKCNAAYLRSMSVFYISNERMSEKGVRCRLERAIYVAVEDYGQNILHVGHLRGHKGTDIIKLVSDSFNIEGLNADIGF